MLSFIFARQSDLKYSWHEVLSRIFSPSLPFLVYAKCWAHGSLISLYFPFCLYMFLLTSEFGRWWHNTNLFSKHQRCWICIFARQSDPKLSLDDVFNNLLFYFSKTYSRILEMMRLYELIVKASAMLNCICTSVWSQTFTRWSF